MCKHFVFIVGMLLTIFTTSAFADDKGGVSGKILDSSGRPVSNARVTVGSKSDFTDDDGQYRIKGLAPGKYSIQVKKGKGKSEERIEIKDQVIDKTITLQKAK